MQQRTEKWRRIDGLDKDQAKIEETKNMEKIKWMQTSNQLC